MSGHPYEILERKCESLRLSLSKADEMKNWLIGSSFRPDSSQDQQPPGAGRGMLKTHDIYSLNGNPSVAGFQQKK